VSAQELPAVPGRPRNLNVANGLTGLRLLAVPLFAWLLLHDGGDNAGWRLSAAVVFVVAILTDLLDGLLARQRNLVTDIGKIADPIADKALVGAALIGLSILDELAWWVTIVILARELLVTVLRLAFVRRSVHPAGRGGKIKTVVQAVAISAYLLPLPSFFDWPETALMGLALILTVATGIDYAVDGLRRRAAAAAREDAAGGE
jgi:CDP-diacylglycerol--glycerol-3-phosphate 3-phosphatidyltransferase